MLRFVSRFSVPLLVVAALAVVEGGLRYFEARLSGDVAQIEDAPRQVRYAERDSGPGVLLPSSLQPGSPALGAWELSGSSGRWFVNASVNQGGCG